MYTDGGQMPSEPKVKSTPRSTSTLGLTGERLKRSWRELLAGGDEPIRRPADLVSRWQVDQTLSTRLFQALREDEPLLVLRKIPAPPSLRTVLAAADRAGLAPNLVEPARTAVDELDALIHELGGNKSNLDTLAARGTDHAREKVEHAAKQQIYRGMSSLRGIQAEVSLVSTFVFPSDDPSDADGQWCDELAVYGFHRLLRLRPELPLVLGLREVMDDNRDGPSALLESLWGETIAPRGHATALAPFCSDPMPTIEVRQERDKLLYVLAEDPDDLPRELDLFFASLHRRAEPRTGTDEHPTARYACIPHTPTRNLVYDLYIHRDLWVGIEPELILARTGDPSSPDLLAHSLDRVDYIETITRHEGTPAAAAIERYARSGHLLSWIHDQMGWTIGDFRLYRCSVRYPVSSLWYTMQFNLPR